MTSPRSALAAILTLALVAAPLAVGAQGTARVYRVGLLSSARAPIGLEGLRQGFRDLGYVEGVNLTLEPRFADLKLERLADFAEELVRLHVDVIVTASTPAAQAAQRATRTIPIVMATGRDPVGSGLVASLGRPGANVTGLTHLAGPEMQQKLLELLKEIAPPVSCVAVITNTTIPPEVRSLEAMREPARRLGVALVPVDIRRPDGFASALEATVRDRADALIAFESPLNTAHRQQIADVAARNRLPTAFGQRPFVEAGGLVSYGTDLMSLYRRAPVYVDKILRGARPADLPVEQPTKFELVVNLRTARTLGLTIPQSVLVRADEVLE